MVGTLTPVPSISRVCVSAPKIDMHRSTSHHFPSGEMMVKYIPNYCIIKKSVFLVKNRLISIWHRVIVETNVELREMDEPNGETE